MNVDVPFHIEDSRRTVTATLLDHVRDMIEQLVFTSPGERVNRFKAKSSHTGAWSLDEKSASKPWYWGDG
jgi:hypothetical protein